MSQPLPPAWDPERDGPLLCVAVRPETHNVTSFVFAGAAGERVFAFLPGQFLTLTLGGVQRCYTIASPPTRPFRLEITAKRTGGQGSAWLHQTLRPGQHVAASGPMGAFVLPPPAARGSMLMLSAGSGITPAMSMARTLHDLGSEADLLFVHSARSPADLVFDAELAMMARRPGFRRISVVETVPPGTAWDGLRGRLTPAVLAAVAPDLLQRTVFCCGPAPYMAAVRTMLDAVGFDQSRYHEESFSFDAPAPETPVGAAEAVATDGFRVTFAKLGRTVTCPGGITVLAAARAAGLRLPSACNRGVCGTCKSRVLAGSVALTHGGGIRQREIDDGLTLLCCARPLADLVVDR